MDLEPVRQALNDMEIDAHEKASVEDFLIKKSQFIEVRVLSTTQGQAGQRLRSGSSQGSTEREGGGHTHTHARTCTRRQGHTCTHLQAAIPAPSLCLCLAISRFSFKILTQKTLRRSKRLATGTGARSSKCCTSQPTSLLPRRCVFWERGGEGLLCSAAMCCHVLQWHSSHQAAPLILLCIPYTTRARVCVYVCLCMCVCVSVSLFLCLFVSRSVPLSLCSVAAPDGKA